VRPLLLCLLVVLAASVPLAFRFFHPFVTLADNGTARYGQAARNFVRHGVVATRGGLAVDMGGDGPPFTYFAHHPPPATPGGPVACVALGVGDAPARAFPAACSLASAVLVFLLWRRCRGDLPAALAGVLLATLPGFGHFGKMLGGEAPTLAFALL